MKQFHIITLFPEMLDALRWGITGKAQEKGLITIKTTNPRDFTHDRHRTVDDRPYGGGPGMVMMAEPLCAAIRAAREQAKQPRTLYLSPQGKPLDQAGVHYLGQFDHLILVAGRYEGIDERVIELEIDEQWSIGDYVLSGGELPAMVLIDAITRQIPGALGHEDSASQDSFAAGLLDCPHYTRPEVFEGLKAPEVLLSGNHEQIRLYRLQQALIRTCLHRPDVLAKQVLTPEEKTILQNLL